MRKRSKALPSPTMATTARATKRKTKPAPSTPARPRRGRPPGEPRPEQIQMRVTTYTRKLWEALRARLQKKCPAGTVTERDAFEWLLHDDAKREAAGEERG